MPNYYGDDGCGYDYRGDSIAESNPPDYPAEWNSHQRITAYWYAQGRNITANTTTSWHGILNAAERESERRHNKINTLITPLIAPTPKLTLLPTPDLEEELF